MLEMRSALMGYNTTANEHDMTKMLLPFRNKYIRILILIKMTLKWKLRCIFY